MNDTAPRFNTANIIAACIVAAGLITAALILAHRPIAVASGMGGAVITAKPLALPPIAQDSAAEQFRAQVLAAPSLHTYTYKGNLYTLADVKVTSVTYSAKDDTFIISYDWVWQPAMPDVRLQSDYSILSNDGYGHYYGPPAVSPVLNGTGLNSPGGNVNDTITIK